MDNGEWSADITLSSASRCRLIRLGMPGREHWQFAQSRALYDIHSLGHLAHPIRRPNTSYSRIHQSETRLEVQAHIAYGPGSGWLPVPGTVQSLKNGHGQGSEVLLSMSSSCLACQCYGHAGASTTSSALRCLQVALVSLQWARYKRVVTVSRAMVLCAQPRASGPGFSIEYLVSRWVN